MLILLFPRKYTEVFWYRIQFHIKMAILGKQIPTPASSKKAINKNHAKATKIFLEIFEEFWQ